MAGDQHELAFTYKGRPAGCFMEPAFPRAPGRYRYMPYRSLGHYELVKAIRAGGQPLCRMAANPRLTFVVLACLGYGILELADITLADAS
jgi:hypothetical protein